MYRKVKTNKKVKNAKSHNYDGIEFKSGLEVNIYKRILQFGITPQYEGHKYIIWKGFKPTKAFFEPNKSGALFMNSKKILDITYTPDFNFYYKGYLIIIEGKGFKTDSYVLKRKMFRQYLENMGNAIYFEIHNLTQLDLAMNIIKSL